jgi:hypothetical protein
LIHKSRSPGSPPLLVCGSARASGRFGCGRGGGCWSHGNPQGC